MMFSYSILLEWVELSRQVSRYEVTEIVHLTVALKSVKEVAKKKQLWCFNDRRQKEIRDRKELCPIGWMNDGGTGKIVYCFRSSTRNQQQRFQNKE